MKKIINPQKGGIGSPAVHHQQCLAGNGVIKTDLVIPSSHPRNKTPWRTPPTDFASKEKGRNVKFLRLDFHRSLPQHFASSPSGDLVTQSNDRIVTIIHLLHLLFLRLSTTTTESSKRPQFLKIEP